MSPSGLRVIFHRLADREAMRAWRRYLYVKKSPAAAQRFRSAIDEAVRRIVANPALGSPFLRGCRWVRVRRFPYLLYYSTALSGFIWILAVAHQARRPGHWLRRLSRP